ncbi:hypothetical protein Cni_G26701 [Canna indica]|uniref:Chromatin assembly factor 1 subunit FAS1 n=1 Tax=Canna indica TaxID=4628 RepID=A0AAQ3QQM8_9LILI|nr:hypothetical protein Cni_G26701 [Canna indica]
MDLRATVDVDRTEESNLGEVNKETVVLDKQHQAKIEGCVVVNRVPEFDEDFMVLDEPKWKQANEEGHQKDICGTHAFGTDIVALKNSTMSMEMVLDSSPVEAGRKLEVKNEHNEVKKVPKRKRISVDWNVNNDNMEFLKAECQKELDELFDYHKEVCGLKLQLDNGVCHSNNVVIAYLLEESSLPFSMLVEEIYEKLKGRKEITLASVRSALLFVGQRSMYGVSSEDADVLEDVSESCLWCWETRDIKMFPTTLRGILNVRRMARKKIHERISALSTTLSVLTSPEHKDDYGNDLMKASIKLGKALNKQGIYSFVERLTQKNCAGMAEKEARLQEKELIKEIERSQQSSEKEKKKMERELQKEKLRSEKELKQVQEEAEREEKRREKEEAELKKQIKKQQEEAAREQRRREKEEAEVKKQLAIRKQASMMERFLKSKKIRITSDDKESPSRNSLVQTTAKIEGIDNTITASMDHAFFQHCSLAMVDIHRFHITSWRKLAKCNRASHWGVRLKPKVELIKELRLQRPSLDETVVENITLEKETSSCEVKYNAESRDDKFDDALESFVNNMPRPDDPNIATSSAWSKTKKLLHCIVGPRCPLRKDPELDYDVDSDEEWEEEDPGESLSDCDKESLEVEDTKMEDDSESEDSFVVPDGYLSENEGVEIDMSSEPIEDEASNSKCCKPDTENEEFRVLFQRQKVLRDLTEKALRKSHPFILSNLNHEKVGLLEAEDLVGPAKVEQICLQALCMQALPGGSIIEILTNSNKYEDHQTCQSFKESSMQAAISDSDLPEFVRLIQSCPNGVNKIVEVLQQKFPTVSKSQLRNKIRELSDFVDNHWQVKKDVLEKLGLPASELSPGKSCKRMGIAVYFSKRCLPPEGESSINIPESSPSCLSRPRSFGTDSRQAESASTQHNE